MRLGGIPCGCGSPHCDALLEATPARQAAYVASDGACRPVCRVARMLIGLEALADCVLSNEPRNVWGEE